MMLTGIAHVHSRLSYDGVHDLTELAAFARGRGLDFVLMSEHNRTLTHETMAELVARCAALTRESGVLMVPGIECEATPDYVHVLGYGTRELVTTRDARGIVDRLRRGGAFTVLAHPMYRDACSFVMPETLAGLDGWEVWNGKADGGLYPGDTSVERLAELRRRGAPLVPMAGADLHRLEAYPGITLEVRCEAPSESAILAALRARAFRIRGGAWAFAASDPLRVPPRSARRLAAGAALGVRRRAKRMHTWLAHHGLRPPAGVARAARRLLK
jgi:hypothetical protein